MPSDIDLIDEAVDRFTCIICNKMRGIPLEQMEEKLNRILETVERC